MFADSIRTFLDKIHYKCAHKYTEVHLHSYERQWLDPNREVFRRYAYIWEDSNNTHVYDFIDNLIEREHTKSHAYYYKDIDNKNDILVYTIHDKYDTTRIVRVECIYTSVTSNMRTEAINTAKLLYFFMISNVLEDEDNCDYDELKIIMTMLMEYNGKDAFYYKPMIAGHLFDEETEDDIINSVHILTTEKCKNMDITNFTILHVNLNPAHGNSIYENKNELTLHLCKQYKVFKVKYTKYNAYAGATIYCKNDKYLENIKNYLINNRKVTAIYEEPMDSPWRFPLPDIIHYNTKLNKNKNRSKRN